MRRLRQFLRSEEGPTSVEYAVLLAMILVICLVGITVFGEQTKASFDKSNTELSSVLGSAS